MLISSAIHLLNNYLPSANHWPVMGDRRSEDRMAARMLGRLDGLASRFRVFLAARPQRLCWGHVFVLRVHPQF